MNKYDEYRIKRIFKYGTETLEDDVLLTYFLFGKVFGWSPRDIENLEWDMVMKLRILVQEYLEHTKGDIGNVGGDLGRMGLF